jgi:hypothetical protein
VERGDIQILSHLEESGQAAGVVDESWTL